MGSSHEELALLFLGTFIPTGEVEGFGVDAD